MHRCMPLDEIEALYEINCLDAHSVEERDRIAAVDIKESTNGAANIGAHFYNALHSSNHS